MKMKEEIIKMPLRGNPGGNLKIEIIIIKKKVGNRKQEYC
jgi:hypothetical protein